MKKSVLSLLLVGLTALMLTGCGKHVCAWCNEEKSCSKIKFQGESIWVCKEDKGILEDLMKTLESLE
ncbi:MAG: hypothetical protein Q4B73_08105 [Lachnospiraceae bacterium]|nr:hypothetical protein [Lachnospiraceae bacterium]